MSSKNTDSNFYIKFSDRGHRQLKKLDRPDVAKVLVKLKNLTGFSPSTPNIKKMQGTKGQMYRYRIGNIRVIFEVKNHTQTIWILDVGYRGSIYN